MTTKPYILVPINITDVMLTDSDISEPDSGETEWDDSSQAYVVGDEVIRTTTHKVYSCVLGHTSAASPVPEDDATHWLEKRPTNKFAAFDGYYSTPSTAVETLTMVVQPGFFNAVRMYAVDGSTATITVKDAPGGTVTFGPTVFPLQEPPIDEYDYMFGQIRVRRKLSIDGLTSYPYAELTIAIDAGSGVPVSVGMIAIGDMRLLMRQSSIGGTLEGATAEPSSNSYVNRQFDGTLEIKRRASATDLRMRVAMPRAEADAAVVTLQEVLDVPACLIATSAPNFAGLDGFGLITGSMSYDSFGQAVLSLYLKGSV